MCDVAPNRCLFSSIRFSMRQTSASVSRQKAEIMTPDKSRTMDAAEKLMLDLMEKHPGASESSLLALFQNVARQRPEVLRAIVGNFMKHSSVG